MSYDTARPYAAAFVLLRRDDGKAAFLLRSGTDWMNGHYGLPAGKVEKDESFLAAAIRETREEVGIILKPENTRHAMTCYRRAEDDTLAWIDVVFEADIWEGEVVNAEPDKHSEVTWFSLDNLPENTVPAVRFILDHIRAGENYCEYGWPDQA